MPGSTREFDRFHRCCCDGFLRYALDPGQLNLQLRHRRDQLLPARSELRTGIQRRLGLREYPREWLGQVFLRNYSAEDNRGKLPEQKRSVHHPTLLQRYTSLPSNSSYSILAMFPMICL